jgi:hypothetical protein
MVYLDLESRCLDSGVFALLGSCLSFLGVLEGESGLLTFTYVDQ